MLLSPPLTAESGPSSPRSLKRAFSDTLYDDTPPPSQPLKRRRGSASAPLPQSQELARSESAVSFDFGVLVSPPEYAFTPYDADFGHKVCQAFKKSLRAKTASDTMTKSLRRHKYGQQDADAYSPGSTPDHLRSQYEASQRQMDKLAADIIANSDSEGEGGSFESGTSSAEWKTKLLQRRKAQSRLDRRERRRRRKESQFSDDSNAKESEEPGLDCKSMPRHATLLRSDDYDETNYDGASLASHGRIGMRCTTSDEYANGRARSFGKEFWSPYVAAS